MIAFILAPANKSLKAYSRKALEGLPAGPDILEFRGEDIPLAIYSLASLNKKAIGLTGEDIFRDFLLKKRKSGLVMLKKITWEDPQALFGKPTLCLLGPKDKSLSVFQKGRELRVGVSAKYKELAKKYLNQLESNGYVFRKISIQGCCETAVKAGLAELIIDVVYTGESMRQAGLDVYDRIFSSDFVIIGSERFWRQNDSI